MRRTYREASAETKKKQSLKKQGNNNPNYGKPRSLDTKKAISKKLKEYWSKIPSRNAEDRTALPSYWKNSRYGLYAREGEMLLFERTVECGDVYYDLVAINDLGGYMTCEAYCWHFSDLDEALRQFEWHATH